MYPPYNVNESKENKHSHIQMTYRQTDRQTDRQTNRQTRWLKASPIQREELKMNLAMKI
jgi:hypothetical protein